MNAKVATVSEVQFVCQFPSRMAALECLRGDGGCGFVKHLAMELVDGMTHAGGIERVRGLLMGGGNGVCHGCASRSMSRVFELTSRFNEDNCKCGTADDFCHETIDGRHVYGNLFQ